ncbi:uncharacterized protein LOC115240702 [Formica exsecta]|uniref:uncharacterized protein LOC115240702 n=1 Tax=Formica exsecta TaxID=72781 RepID=UPI001141BD9B|nr:uncharacterized protein LOC115240702 [Formica exsecta]
MKHPKALIDVTSAGDYGFIHGDRNVITNKVYYGDRASQIVSTLQESQEPVIDDTIGQVRTDNLSTSIASRNVDSLPPVKSESNTPEINQQQSRDRFKLLNDQHSQEYDISSQSPELQNYTQEDSVSNTTDRLQQQWRITRCIPQTLAITSMKQPCSRREYHTWKMPEIENHIKCYGLSRFDGLTCSGSSSNQGSRHSPLCLSSVPHRHFSSKSCIVVQNSVQKIETSKKGLPITGRVSLTKLQSFSCDASKKSSEENDECKSQRKPAREVENDDCGTRSRKVAKNRCRDENEKKCGKTQQKDVCGRNSRVSSRKSTTCEKEQEKESCKHNTCPELLIRQCNWERELDETGQKRDAKERATQSKDPNCSQKKDIDTRCCQRQRSKSCTGRKDYEEPSRVACKNSSKRKNDCRESKSNEKRCAKSLPERCAEYNPKRSESGRKRKSSRVSDKNCGKINEKRRYSQQSIFSVPRDHRSFSTLIPDIVLDTNVRKTTKALYSSSEDEKKDLKQSLSCEEQKRKCGTTKKDETKKKCVKGPAKCLSRKSIVDKMQICQSTQKDQDKMLREPTQKSCDHTEYCSNRKLEYITKDKEPKEKLAKEQLSSTGKDKKPMEESIKEQIEREYKEIDECKKIIEQIKVKEPKEKKDKIPKKTDTDYKPTGLDRVISPCKQEDIKDTKKFISTPNEPFFSNFMDTAYKMLRVRSNIINGEIPIIPKDIKLMNIMFDRSFSTTKVSYQNDFAVKRTTGHSKTVQNCSANNSDFIHGDELPNYVETENDDEEEDEYDWIIGRPTSGIN